MSSVWLKEQVYWATYDTVIPQIFSFCGNVKDCYTTVLVDLHYLDAVLQISTGFYVLALIIVKMKHDSTTNDSMILLSRSLLTL